MKDLVISYNEQQGFYCECFSSHLFYKVLEGLIGKHNLKFERKVLISEIEMYFLLKELNPEYNIELIEEDGSQLIFG